MTEAQENPPWVDRVLNQNWPAIVRRFGDMVPVHTTSPRGKIVPGKEFGCGHYGCVLATAVPGVVFKVTSDPTEAAFVTAATQVLAETKEWPEGMVRYYGLFQVPEGSHKRRSVYVLARQEAERVGELTHRGRGLGDLLPDEDRQQHLMEIRTSKRLIRFKQFASIVRDRIVKSPGPRHAIESIAQLEDWAHDAVDYEATTEIRDTYPSRPPVPKHLKGVQAAAYALQACRYVAQEMINEDVGYLIGGALEFYLDHGMLLADVHAGNIGKIIPEGYAKPVWAITDPGHMVPIDVRWLDLEVPVL